MGSEKFCLRWNDFESNISQSFSEIREEKDFFDVTLACDDDQIQAHKVIISACSAFFRKILKKNPHQSPLLYLKGVRFNDLQSIMQFMYHGEVNVAQEDLNSFLAVAEDLQIKGLTQNHSKTSTSSSSVKQTPVPQKDPLPNRVRPVQSQHDEVQEVVAIKAEPKDALVSTPTYTPPQPRQPRPPPAASNPPTVPQAEDRSVATYHEETAYEEYDSYGNDQDQQYEDVNTTLDHVVVPTEHDKGPLNPEDLGQYVVSDMNIKEYHCALCDTFKAKLPSKVKNHLEAIHFPGLFLYTCEICQKTLKGRNALNIHKSTMHSKKMKSLLNLSYMAA